MLDTAPSKPQKNPIEITWAQELRAAYTSLDEVLVRFALQEFASRFSPPSASFPVVATETYLSKIKAGDPLDPLLLQILPLAFDRQQTAGDFDPVGDLLSVQAPGILQKYAGRALLITTGSCAIHCRYCFRQHFSYADQNLQPKDLRKFLLNNPEIKEVIFSGGDPLTLTDQKLAKHLDLLATIPSVRMVRFHTRIPTILPRRITSNLCQLLTIFPGKVVVVLHVNHPNELCGDLTHRAISRLRQCNAMLLNQSVLLRGVNDSVDIQCSLSMRLVEMGVLPYYLHQLDPVKGAMHFSVPKDEALSLMDSLREKLPGYCVPKFVQEVPGESSKTPLG